MFDRFEHTSRKPKKFQQTLHETILSQIDFLLTLCDNSPALCRFSRIFSITASFRYSNDNWDDNSGN